MRKQNDLRIICPNCGYEYLPAEIFVPSSFLGKPYKIIRDENNKIVSFCGDTMNLNESYFCDNCNKPLKIATTISFQVVVDKDNDFTEEYKTKIERPQLTLDEV